jgi:hypothetical protein
VCILLLYSLYEMLIFMYFILQGELCINRTWLLQIKYLKKLMVLFVIPTLTSAIFTFCFLCIYIFATHFIHFQSSSEFCHWFFLYAVYIFNLIKNLVEFKYGILDIV